MSELRQDITSGDWVIIAPGRSERPQMLEGTRSVRIPSPKKGCPFENPDETGHTPLASYPSGKNWKILVVQNKYPALSSGDNFHPAPLKKGLNPSALGIGRHELVITRDHLKNFFDLDPKTAAQVLQVFQARYKAAAKDQSILYATTFLNYGSSVGSSLWHPHYQFMAMPFIPQHVTHSVRGAAMYFKKNHRCVRCDIIQSERKNGTRVIAENKDAIALAPFASKRPFEVRVLPKKHFPAFEKTPVGAMRGVAEILQSVLRAMKKNVKDPDLNFFVHSVPFDKEYDYHHWHIEVVPHISYLGGLEYSTGTYINVIDPDEAAKILRGDKMSNAK